MPKLGDFIYRAPPVRVRAPALGAAYFKFRYRNGYVPGIVATKRLDRFLSYGVVLGRFVPRRWYAVPPELSREFRRLTAKLSPLSLTRAAVAKSR